MYYPKNNCPNCPIVQLSATPCPERLLPYKTFHTHAQLLVHLSCSVPAISNPYKGTKFTSRRCRLRFVILSLRCHHHLLEHLHPTNL